MLDRTSLSNDAPSAVVEHALEFLDAQHHHSAQSIEKLGGVMWQFAGFIERGCGITSLADVSSSFVSAFCSAPTRDRRPPSVAVMHLRRSSARLLYRSARQLGHDLGDPTVDVSLPARCSAPFRPLQDDEVDLARAVALWSPDDVRLTTAWALCEATARTSELPAIRACDIDLVEGTVWLHGSTKAQARRASLTNWGLTQIARRIDRANSDDELLLGIGPQREARAQSSAVMVVSTTLRRAGLHREPDLRPSSVAAWAGRRVFDRAGRIEDAARALGMSSLDRAARFVGWSWVEPE